MKKEYDGLSVVPGAPDVTITAEEYREYRELQKERDRTVASIRTRMRMQNDQAMRLARAVTSSLLGDTALGVAIVNNATAATALELANELLATE